MRDSHLIIVDYDPRWVQMFADEKARLLDVVGDYVQTIEHIGSTSVPGLAAKPVIDIAIGVGNLAEVEHPCIEGIQRLGYEYVKRHEEVMPDRRFFRRSDASGMRTHHIHLWPVEHSEYKRHVLFRDYLRAHPDEAAAYETLKRELVTQFDDGNDYADAKTDFIRACEKRAFQWSQR